MSIRDYNKIHVHSDREEGSEKILLGYKNDLAEIVLKKENETIFHIPLYADTIYLQQTTLVADGATAGPFPAASDRIFKNNKNYGASTPYGNTSDIANGLWFCSWLHKDEYGKVQWKDRFYNPGYFRQNTARTQLLEYVPHNPIYEDRPSKMSLEQGVQYKYFHIGEKYASSIITSYGGLSGERLMLNLNGWGTNSIDTSNVPKTVKIVTNDTANQIYIPLTDSDRVTLPNLNFNNSLEIAASIEYDPSYNFSDEFTLAFWAHSTNWQATPSTQLVGNYTNKGGYGIFIDTLSSYPFFVIPETGYGHLLFVNEKLQPFLDKSVHPTVLLTATPSFVAINSNNEVLTIEVNKFHKLKKFDHTGVLLREVTLESTVFPTPTTQEGKLGNTWALATEYNLTQLKISEDYSIWTAINNNGELIVSIDGGINWSVKDYIARCSNISMSRDGIIQTAVTTDGKAWLSFNKGERWIQSTNETSDLINLTLTDVAMSQDGQIQAVVAYGDYIYFSDNYGYSWYKRAFVDSWKKLIMSGDGEYAIALAEQQFYVSQDYGNTWFSKEQPRIWSDIAMSQNGLIQTAVSKNNGIYLSTDHGQTWTTVENTIEEWIGIGMSPTGEIQTAVASRKSSLYVYMSFDYGTTWELKQIIPQVDTGKIVIKVNSDGTNQMILTDGAAVYVTGIDRLQQEYTLIETPLQLLCGQNDTVTVITDKARYEYDEDLNLLNAISWRTLPQTVAAYSWDTRRDVAELISVENVYDCKFINTDCYCISATENLLTDGNLWVKYARTNVYELYADIGGQSKATAFGIDPFNRIWLMHDTNKITVYDAGNGPGSDPVISTFSIGSNISYAKKNISFTCMYDRATNTRVWRAVVYYGDSGKNIDNPQLFMLDMDGHLVRTIDILSLFDLYTVKLLNQKQENMEFLASGDFTGYEFRRVFNNLSPFKGTPQIVLRTALTDLVNKQYPFVHTKRYWPINDWNFKRWQHFILTLKNRTFTLYNNSLPIMKFSYPGNQTLSYVNQPSFFIGSPTGARFGFNYEIGNSTSLFNGSIQDVRIYDYAIEPNRLEMFLRATTVAEDLHWTLPTPMIQYIETIERFFKNKLPGSKSPLFNIKLYGTQIKDPGTRKIIENEIRALVTKIKPAYIDMVKVIWIE